MYLKDSTFAVIALFEVRSMTNKINRMLSLAPRERQGTPKRHVLSHRHYGVGQLQILRSGQNAPHPR
jgi:hypothetical protein